MVIPFPINWILALIYLLVMLWACFYLIGSFIATFQASGVPYVPSYNEDLNRMKAFLKLKKWKTMIDLWCWDWKALRFFSKEFAISKWVWIDFNLPAIIYWRLINKALKIDNVEIRRWNFLKEDISKYDYIYVYLLSEYLVKIEDFVFENMRDDAIIISNTFKFKNHEPYEVHMNDKWRDRILLYKKDSKIISK
jgi:hypothetical protein